jgi:hypothetical protein
MASDSTEKDRPDVPPQSVKPSPIVSQPADSGAEWPRLLARIVEGIVRAELHQFEENVRAFLNSAVEDAYASFIWICARVIGVALLLTALILFLGIWLQWWTAFALVGVAVLAMGSRTGPKHRLR